MSQIKAKIIEDSMTHHGVRLTTFQLQYHRYIHGEFMTHRVFSRNASSSRAIPVMTMLKQVWNDPAMPVHWGANIPGMQAKDQLTGWRLKLARGAWRAAGKVACGFAWGLSKLGLHKQVANRILEPWQLIHVIMTATEFSNFFALRDHSDAQPEIRVLAALMREAYKSNVPVYRRIGEWHLPYVSYEERKVLTLDQQIRVSAARCARVSYLTHDGQHPVVKNDIALYERLVGSEPIHASPVEHQATPHHTKARWGGNLRGWHQHRQDVEKTIAIASK